MTTKHPDDTVVPTWSQHNKSGSRLSHKGGNWLNSLFCFKGNDWEYPGQVIPFPNLQGSILIPTKSDLRNPHIVVLYGTGKIVCNCVNNKSLFICLHSIVYTEHQNIQPKFYTLLKKVRRDQGSYSITLSNLVSASMPLGRGQKGERPPRAKKPTVSYTTTQATSSTATCKHQFRRKDRAATFAEIPHPHRNRCRWTNLWQLSRPLTAKPINRDRQITQGHKVSQKSANGKFYLLNHTTITICLNGNSNTATSENVQAVEEK